MPAREIGTAIVVVGIVIVVLGALVSVGGLSWFGRLPGDVRIETERVRVYVPLVSMLLVSVVLSVLVAVARRLL